MMAKGRPPTYLVCTRLKGRKKKHIAVCRRCHWNGRCAAFQAYSQPELPLGTFSAPKKLPAKGRPVYQPVLTPTDAAIRWQRLITEIREVLLEIRDLCAVEGQKA